MVPTNPYNPPKHWQLKKLNQVGKCITGNTPPKVDLANYGDFIPFVKPPQINNQPIFDAPEKLSKKGSELSRILPPNSVLVTCIGNLGRIGINKLPIAFNQQINAVIPNDDLNAKFLFYQLQTSKFRNTLEALSAATTVAIVNKGKFETISILYPPLPEQHLIVSKIEELFSELDKGIENLQTALAQLKTYRQSVLKWAFEGRLTEEWRKKNSKKYNAFEFLLDVKKKREAIFKKEKRKEFKNFDFKFSQSTDIQTWAEAELDKLIYIAGRIGWRGLTKDEYKESGPLFMSVHSLNYGKYVDYKQAFHISKERYDESPEIQLKENDILLCKDGAGIGKIAIVKDLPDIGTVNSSLLIIRGLEVFIPEFLFYLFSGPALQTIVRERISGSTTPHLFQNDIRQFQLLVPPIEEQQAIVQEIESRLSVADKMEETINQSLQQAEALRQSILKMAFEGRLV